MANYHLVILKKPYLDAILNGKKKIESRFLKTRRYYLSRIKAGDCLFLKQSSGPVCAVAKAQSVKIFENLTTKEILQIKQKYNHLICGQEDFWQGVTGCRFAFLIWLTDVREIEPVRINKKDWRGWVVLTEKEDFGLFKLIKKNFEALISPE